MPAPITSARDEVRPVVPKLIELSEKVLYGDVWERPGLSKRNRSLITHIAFYSGWPTAITAARIAKGVFDQQKK